MIGLFVLRTGIAVVFLYAAIASILEPSSWIGFIPLWLRNLTSPIISTEVLLITFSVFQIVLAFWLLSGKRIKVAAIISVVTLTGIVVVNIGILDIVFRDIAIILSAIALALLSKE